MEDTDSNPPLKLNERRVVNMPIAVLMALLAGAVSSGMGYMSLFSRQETIAEETHSNGRSIAHLQSRVDAIEQQRADMSVLQNDVTWIKQTLLQIRQEQKRGNN